MSKPISARIPEDLDAKLEAFRVAHGLSRSAALAALLQAALDGEGAAEAVDGLPDLPAGAEVKPKHRAPVSVYFSRDEKGEILGKARRYGLTLSDFLRRLGLAQQLPTPIKGAHLLLNQLQRVGANLNQIARALNAARLGAHLPPDAAEIRAAILDTQEVLSEFALPFLQEMRGPLTRRVSRSRARRAPE